MSRSIVVEDSTDADLKQIVTFSAVTSRIYYSRLYHEGWTACGWRSRLHHAWLNSCKHLSWLECTGTSKWSQPGLPLGWNSLRVKYCCTTGWRKRNPGAAFILRGDKYQFHTATWLLLFKVSLSYYSSPTRLSIYKKKKTQLFVKYLALSFIFCTIYLYDWLFYTVMLLNCVFDVMFTV